MATSVDVIAPDGRLYVVDYRSGVQRKRTGLGNASGKRASAYVRGLVEAAVELLELHAGYGVDGGTLAYCAAGCRCEDTGLPIVGGIGRASLVSAPPHVAGALVSVAPLEADRVALDLPGWQAPDGLPYAPATVAPVCGDCNGNVAHRERHAEELGAVARRLLEHHATVRSDYRESPGRVYRR